MQPTEASLDRADRLVRDWLPHGRHAVQALGSAGGFSGARLWRVSGDLGEFCLRAMPRDAVDLDRLNGLHHLLAHIARVGRGEVVAVPRTNAAGNTFTVHGSTVWQLEPWLPGRADFRTCPSRARLAASMRALAGWHLAAREFNAPPASTAWFYIGAAPSPGLAERGRLIARSDPSRCNDLRAELPPGWPEFVGIASRILDLYQVVAPVVALELDRFRTCDLPLQPCLRDIWHDHVLLTGDDVSGLIDAHACRVESVAADLARLLGSLVGDTRELWDDALAIYDSVRPLSTREREAVLAFDHSGVALQGLTWIEWIAREHRQFEDRAAVCRRLNEILGRLQILSEQLHLGPGARSILWLP